MTGGMRPRTRRVASAGALRGRAAILETEIQQKKKKKERSR